MNEGIRDSHDNVYSIGKPIYGDSSQRQLLCYDMSNEMERCKVFEWRTPTAFSSFILY